VIRRSFAVLGLSVAVSGVSNAQIIGQPARFSTNPSAWTSLSIGWMQQRPMCDGDSNACWSFSAAPQWRATLEFPMGTGSSFGVAGTMSRVPLIYSGSALVPNSCGRCDATANISQLMGSMRMGGGEGFHQVIDLSAGVTLFSNFRAKDGTRLGTGKAAQDFSFGVGYGFGYGFSPRTSIMVVQDYGLIIYKKQAGTSNNTAEQTNLRVGIRMGVGSGR
jgi:hypothetical protein